MIPGVGHVMGGFGGPVLWTPLNLGVNLRAWWSAITETEADAANIVTIHDRSGNNENLNYGSVYPTMEFASPYKYYRFGGYVGQPARFAGTITMSASQGCYFAVAQVDADPSAGANNGPILDGFGSGSTGRWPQTNGNIIDGFGSTTTRDFGNPSPALTSMRIYSCHSASNDHRAYLDGTLLASFGTNTVNFGSGTRYIGSSNDLGNALKGYVGEIILCVSALTTDERQKVEGYLAHKYGLTGNLPGGHPYITNPPTL